MPSGIPDTHDGLFHFYRMMALDEALNDGCAFPRWLPDFAFGYGQPVFAFYGAGSYYQALSLKLVGLPPEAAWEGSILLAFLLSGVATYGVARRLVGRWPAALAGAAYVLFPYRLADVYVRGAFAEHWALALLPLLLLLGERALLRRDRASWAVLAAVWGMLVFTHNLSALVFAPIWITYLAVVAIERGAGYQRSGLILWARVVLALPAGALLVAFYWLPIPCEARLVGLGNTFSTDAWGRYLTAASETVSRHLTYRYFPEQGVAHQYPLGLMAVALAMASIAAGAVRGWVRRPRWWFFAGLMAVCWGLQWQGSAAIWRLFPILGFVQFPWRLMGPLALGWAVLVGVGWQEACRWWRLSEAISAAGATGLAAALVVTSLGALPRHTVPVGSERWVQHMWDHDAAIGQVGATWTAEYVPIWVTVDRSAMPWDPVETDRPPEHSMPKGLQVHALEAGPYSLRLSVDSPAPLRLSRHSFYYPGHTVTVDGQKVEVVPFTDMGLVSATVPAGRHEVRFDFGATTVVWAGRALAALAVAGLVLYVTPGRRTNGLLMAAGAALLVLTSVACCPVERPVRSTWTVYEDEMALIGWQALDRVRPGQTLVLDLYWLPLQTPQENLKVFVHLEAEDGRVVAQSDGDPVGGYTRTSRMAGGEVSTDRRWLEVPDDAGEGRYALYVGLYRWPDVTNLRVSQGQEVGAERVLLGLVEVRR